MVVVVLFAYGEILGAQQERTVIAFCSHPGASRYLDGSFLNDDPSKGDVVAVHYSPAPGVDDYFRESVAESGVHPTLEWLTYSNWSDLIEVPRDQYGDIIVDSNGTIDCTLYAEFQIGKRTGANEYTYRVANAQVGPCVPSTDGVTHVSVRVWLNKNKNPEHEAKPCGEEVPGELEIINRPVTPSQPLVTTPTGGGGSSGNGGGGGGSDGSGGGTTTGDTNGPDGDSDGQEDGEEDAQEDGQSDGQEGGQPDGQEQADGADEQEHEQQDSAGSTPSQDSDDGKDPSDPEDDSQSVDVPEAENNSDTATQDLLEQERQAAEETDTQTAQVDEDNAQTGESGRTAPRVPGTGTGGAVDSKRELSWQVVLGVSLGTVGTIALLLLGFNRRSSRRTG